MGIEYQNKEWLYDEYWNKKKSIEQIARDCNKSPANVHYFRKKFNIEIRNRTQVSLLRWKKEPVQLSDLDYEFIIGNVLGDGGIFTRQANGQTASYAHSSKYEKFISYIKHRMENIGFDTMGRVRKYQHKYNKGIYYCYWTKQYDELSKLRNYLYPDGKKVIPKDLEFTPEICLQWYLGDGSLSHPKIGGSYIRICTQGFSESDVKFAVEKFNNMGLKTYRQKSGNTIRFANSSTLAFLNYIGPCPQEIENIYGYKFNYNKKEL